MNLDLDELAAAVAARLECGRVVLTPVAVECAWPVFRAESEGRSPVFVKVTEREAAERLLSVLEHVRGRPFFPRPLVAGIPFHGHVVVCTEWLAGDRVNAEDMTDGQLDGFLDCCVKMSEALAGYAGKLRKDEADSPDVQYASLARYASRHRIVGRMLSPLLDIPEPERTYGGRKPACIHGDFQPKNYGFSGDRVSAVYDLDDVTTGLPCEDAAYAFTERFRRRELSAAARRRLSDLFRRFVERSPWPEDEWLIAVNHARLRIASRRLEKHPDSPFAAFDIRLRDRPLRELYETLKMRNCPHSPSRM